MPGSPFPPDSPFRAAAGGVAVAVRLTPKAGRDRVEAVTADAEGNGVLKVSVTAVPEKGKANQALIKLLAKEWGVAKSTLAIAAGAKDRNKVVMVRGEARDLGPRLQQWRAERGL